ncbi:MAG: hypothetical protein R3F31_13315 [Verrucomicrobiales bacterium]
MSPLFQTVLTVFREAGWDSQQVPDRPVITAGFDARNGRVSLHVQAFAELSAISVVAESSHLAHNPAIRERLAELAMRANLQLTVGNFEMDWPSGRLYFRATNLFSEKGGDPRLIRGLVETTIIEMDRLTPLLDTLCRLDGPALAGFDLEQALAACEPE